MNGENTDNANKDINKPKRKFLGVFFTCCKVYGRLYQNKFGTAYVGRCPRCLRPIKVPIDSNSSKGTSRRFFSAN